MSERTVTIACHEGFDLDLYYWKPEASEIIAPIGPMPLYTFGDIDDAGKLLSVCYWNGFGCLFFTESPKVEIDSDGWINFHGMVTRAKVICLTVEMALRYLFVQGYESQLNLRPWTNPTTIALDIRLGGVNSPISEKAELWLRNAINDVRKMVGA